jgi:uncharacterized protein YggE
MMRRLVAAALLSMTLTAAHGQNDKLPRVITVTGEGEVSIVPDIAILSGGVTTTAKTAREASEANAKAMTAVMAALKGAGIEERDVQTSRLSLQPLRDHSRNEARINGFQASNQVRVKVRDVSKAAELIDRVTAAGANDIYGIQFVVSSPSKPLDAAREAAIADARRKAEVYAKAANVQLGAAVNISEDGGAAPPRPMMRHGMEVAATPISPGEQTQRVSVTVSYELLR